VTKGNGERDRHNKLVREGRDWGTSYRGSRHCMRNREKGNPDVKKRTKQSEIYGHLSSPLSRQRISYEEIGEKGIRKHI